MVKFNIENNSKKKAMWERAKKIIPSGNNFLSKNPSRFPVKNWPIYFSKSKGCQIWDLNKKNTMIFVLWELELISSGIIIIL